MKTTLLTLALLLPLGCLAGLREETYLNDGWQFSRDKSTWENVTLPHDWAISGPFDKKWDLQVVAIEQNGEKQKTEKSGRSGSLPWIGRGYYKTTIDIPAGCGHAELLFDGAMSEPTITVNGKRAGYWAYGYNAFTIDITPFVKTGKNSVEVELNNVEESSRWYPGGGIYRPVQLITTEKEHFETFSTYFRTNSIDGGVAMMTVGAKAVGGGQLAANIALRDQRGWIVAESHLDVPEDGSFETALDLKKPNLWTPETPYLYTLETTLYKGGKAIDHQTTKVGIRTVKVSKDGGFQLNGKSRKLKGVCLHHDLGPLGAAINKAALARQILTMKDMGCDAIRTSHNMPSTWQMELCDSLGMMVMAESFDMWEYPKCKNGYARFFNEWADRDITNLVMRHRNHPAIVMWSIGNEIPEQGMKKGPEMAKHLQDICHRLDPTRPVTQGMDRVDNALATGFAQAMDVPGFNYRLHRYEKGLKELSQGFLLGSETVSAVSSRGVYKFPAEPKINATYPDGQCSGYDTEHCKWSNLPDDDWRWQEDYPQVIGEFVWTGYDYLGEPTPYDEYWPSRSSYFGICDLAGLPKDRYWLYRSHWNTEAHTVHLLPHWTWPDRKGKTTPVYCYTDGVEGELFINGKSQGRVRKQNDKGQWKIKTEQWTGYTDSPYRLDRYRLRWNNVKYEPGEAWVVAYDKDGKEIGTDTIRTAGKPAGIKLEADRTTLKADGNDMAFITVSLADAKGTECPTATDQMTFTVEGAGAFQAVCNGDATSTEVFTEPTMKLFAGKLVLVVRAAKTKGDIKITATDKQRKFEKAIQIKAI